MRTPHDDKIDAFTYSLTERGKPEHLPQLYETEDEPEPVEWSKEWPKVNPFLTPEKEKKFMEACGAYTEELNAFVEYATPYVERLAAAIGKMARLVEAYSKTISETLRPITINISSYPNKKVIHLAKHAKKARTRKKNINRIIKDITTARSGPR